MYGKNDRVILQALYAKMVSIEHDLNEWIEQDKQLKEKLAEPQIADSELPPPPAEASPFLNEDGLYSAKAFLSKREMHKRAIERGDY